MSSVRQLACDDLGICPEILCRRFVVPSFNPKPEAMAGATCRRSVPLLAIASGFGLNGLFEHDKSQRRDATAE
jgi:hypothetical protein